MKISRILWWAIFISGMALLAMLFQRVGDARDCETCKRTKTGNIFRSREAVNAFRAAHPCPATGKTRGACKGYVVDHLVPLACSDDIARAEGRQTAEIQHELDAPANMQWQDHAASKVKDRWERRYCLKLRRNPLYTPQLRKKPAK